MHSHERLLVVIIIIIIILLLLLLRPPAQSLQAEILSTVSMVGMASSHHQTC